MKVLTGPVVGTVCPEFARFLIEVDAPCELVLTLRPKDKAKDQALHAEWTRTAGAKARPFCPVVFVVTNLRRGTAYAYEVKTAGGEPVAESVFYFPGEQENMRVLAVSCNALQQLRPGDVDMWNALLQDHDTEDGLKVDALYHIGDQIYEYAHEVHARGTEYIEHVLKHGQISGAEMNKIDKRWSFNDCHDEWKIEAERDYTRAETYEIVTDMFKALHRWFWNHPATRRILSRVSNEMIYDDHDIRNGWGIFANDHVPDTVEYCTGRCAYRAYLEYQAQLFRDVYAMEAKTDVTGKEDRHYRLDYRLKKRGSAAIFMMDLRTARSFLYDKNYPYCGKEQLDVLKRVCADVSIRNLLIIGSVPLVLASNTKTNAGAMVDFTNDVRDQWAYWPHQKEHRQVLTTLFDWKRAKPNEHNLMLLGGDVHFAIHSYVYEVGSKIVASGTHKGKKFHKAPHEMPIKTQYSRRHHHPKFKRGMLLAEQVITSPITNEPNSGFQGWMLNVFAPRHLTLYGLCNLRHDFRAHRRNYAYLWCPSQPPGAGAASLNDPPPGDELVLAGTTLGMGAGTGTRRDDGPPSGATVQSEVERRVPGPSDEGPDDCHCWRYKFYIDRTPAHVVKKGTRVKKRLPRHKNIKEGQEVEKKVKSKPMKDYGTLGALGGSVLGVFPAIFSFVGKAVTSPFRVAFTKKTDLEYYEKKKLKEAQKTGRKPVVQTRLPDEVIVYP